jgi:hypothetical protein
MEPQFDMNHRKGYQGQHQRMEQDYEYENQTGFEFKDSYERKNQYNQVNRA